MLATCESAPWSCCLTCAYQGAEATDWEGWEAQAGASRQEVWGIDKGQEAHAWALDKVNARGHNDLAWALGKANARGLLAWAIGKAIARGLKIWCCISWRLWQGQVMCAGSQLVAWSWCSNSTNWFRYWSRSSLWSRLGFSWRRIIAWFLIC